MSKSLTKIIDYSLFPAALLVIAKLIGVLLIALVFSVDINFQANPSALLLFNENISEEEKLLVYSYSDLAMFAVVSFGYSVILIGALYFHESHISVKAANLLAKYDLLSLIRDSFELYHAGVIWLIFVWIANLVILYNSVSGKTYPWIVVVTTAFAIMFTIIMIRDFLQELDLAKKKNLYG